MVETHLDLPLHPVVSSCSFDDCLTLARILPHSRSPLHRASQADKGTVQYHSNRAAAKEMSKTFGEMFMAASLLDSPNGRDGKSVMRASEVAKKQRELKEERRSHSRSSAEDEALSPRAALPSSAAAEQEEQKAEEAVEKVQAVEKASDEGLAKKKADVEAGKPAMGQGSPDSTACKFESDKPGMDWGGSVCKHCGQKKKDHA